MERVFGTLIDRMSSNEHCIIRRLSQNSAEERSFYRLLWNEKVCEVAIVEQISKTASSLLQGEHILSISDSTDFDYTRRKKHIGIEKDLGYIGDHKGWGYNGHVHLNVSAQDGRLLGLGHVHLWHREAAKRTAINYWTPLEEKESFRWPRGCRETKKCLQGAALVTFIQDREGDMFETFATIPDERHHLLIRQQYNRRIRVGPNREELVKDYLKGLAACGSYRFIIPKGHSKKAGRVAYMEARWAQVDILKNDKYAYEKNYPKSLTLYVVQVKEYPWSVPQGEEPIEWCLWTTHPVTSFADVLQIVYWYSLRWLIEEFFRILKKEGFRLENSELDSGTALRKMGLLAMKSAISVLQLKQAREGNNNIPIQAVFDSTEQECLEQLNPILEGKTQALKNPHQPKTLAWATWIIARLGGWKGYASQRPPGVITLKNGLDQFHALFIGWKLSRDALVYKP